MSQSDLILAMDQGTTSSRGLVFNTYGEIVAVAQQEFAQHYPADGWVEHNPEDIWSSAIETAQDAVRLAEAKGGKVATIGITNQRETVLIWDRETGEPIGNALVWQDRRTAETCASLKEDGYEGMVNAKTGLLLDPYFSASKVAWMLSHIEGAREKADAGELAFGTVDTFLIWRLTGGQQHVTDETNASRTSLFNIHENDWDQDLLNLFRIPRAMLPKVLPSAAEYGVTTPELFGRELPIQGVAGDQQAAAFGQGCTKAGMAKSTYGTGCFLLMHTGTEAISSQNRLLTTRACRASGPPVFALEGSIFIAGAVAQWLRDGLGVIEQSPETEVIAAGLDGNGGVFLVPAFTGLGAPHWDAEARGAIYGLTRQSGRAEIVRAALESVGYQTADLISALEADGAAVGTVRIDGGMSKNNWLSQFIADITNAHLQRPENVETTALGAAKLAGIQAGIWQEGDHLDALSGGMTDFAPKMDEETRQTLRGEWDIAVKTTRYREQLRRDA